MALKARPPAAPSATVAVGTPPTAQPRRSAARRAHRWPPRPALALFLVLASLYALTSSGHTYSFDEETMFALTASLAERGSVEIPTCGECAIIRAEPLPGGRNYSRYGPLQSLAAVPLYWAGELVAGDSPVASAGRWFTTRFFAVLLDALATAGTATLLYGLVRGLGYSTRIGLACALLYGLGTQAWPHSKTFFAEPLTTMFLLTAVVCWWQLERAQAVGRGAWAVRSKSEGVARPSPVALRPTAHAPRPTAWAAALGLACGLAMATKWAAAIALPVLGLALAATLYRWWRAGGLAPRRALAIALAAEAGLAVPVALVALYNAARFGSPFATGYGANELGAVQTGLFWMPLWAFLVSPGKSVFLFSPVALLALPAWPRFFRRHRPLALVALGLILTHLGFYARVPHWHGDVAWGPRHLDYVVPLLVLPLATLLSAERPNAERGARSAEQGTTRPHAEAPARSEQHAVSSSALRAPRSTGWRAAGPAAARRSRGGAAPRRRRRTSGARARRSPGGSG